MKAEAEVVALVRGVTDFTREQVELLKRSVVPQGCPDDDFQLFIEQCKHTGLNPFLKQAWLVERSMKVRERSGQEHWVTRYEFQAAEMGMAARANGFADFKGIVGAAVYDCDDFQIEASEGAEKVHHIFNPAKRRKEGNLIGAWAHVRCEGRVLPITYLTLESRIQTTKDGRPNKFWATMPDGQIAKCARAEQYRLAYPIIFSGVHIPEERPDEEPEKELNPAPSRTEQVRQEMKARGLIVDVKPGETEEEAAARQALPAQTGLLLRIPGDKKGTPIAELAYAELSGAVDWAQKQLQEKPTAKKAPELKQHLDELLAELQRRDSESSTQGAPEMGESG